MQTAKASRKQSSLSGKESAQGCIPTRSLYAKHNHTVHTSQALRERPPALDLAAVSGLVLFRVCFLTHVIAPDRAPHPSSHPSCGFVGGSDPNHCDPPIGHGGVNTKWGGNVSFSRLGGDLQDQF